MKAKMPKKMVRKKSESRVAQATARMPAVSRETMWPAPGSLPAVDAWRARPGSPARRPAARSGAG